MGTKIVTERKIIGCVIRLNPLVFVAFLTLLSLAMTAAMVKFSEGWLNRVAEAKRRWGLVYVSLWIAIVWLLLAFTGFDDRKNLLIIAAAPAVWFAVHAVLLKFAAALRDAGAADREKANRFALSTSRFAPPQETDEEVEEDIAPAAPPTAWDRILGAITTIFRWAVALFIAAVIMAFGEAIPAVRRLDLIPFRPILGPLLWTLVILGFIAFMGGIIHLILRGQSRQDGEFHFDEIKAAWRSGTWRTKTRFRRFFVIATGVFLMIVSGGALLIVFGPPGVKALIIVALAYTLVRMIIALVTPPASSLSKESRREM